MVGAAQRTPTGEHLADPERFRVFYAAALPRVYAYLHRRCGRDVALAEDLTQEVFLAVVHDLRRGTAVADPVPWVLGIARHKLLDHYRQQERTGREPSVTFEADELEDQLVVPDDAQARERAIQALVSVAASQRAALVLCYVDGFSVAETAKRLDKSVEAVESLLARGRQSFKRAYLKDAA